MRWIGAAFVAVCVVAVGGALLLAAPTVAAFVAAMAQAVIIFVYVCIGLVALWGMVGAWWWVTRTTAETLRQRDGAFPLQKRKLEPWTKRVVNVLMGRPSVEVIVDFNALMSHAAATGVFGVQEFTPAAGYDRQLEYNREIERTRRAQAVSPGDNVTGNPLVSLQRGTMGVPNAATGRLLAGAYDRTPHPVRVEPTIDASHQLPPPPPANLSLADGLHQGDAQNWPLGYAADGTLATFAPLRHAHAGIVGATGTGKTSSVGYLLAAHALRNGWHVVILDADNGNAWTPFAAHAEHVEADAETLPDQMAALYDEFQRRARLLADAGAADMLAMPDAPPRVLAVIEEYGDLMRTLRLRSPKAADTVDAQLDSIFQRGRKTGVHMVLLDQYPAYWSNQTWAGAKWLAAFKLGPGQGSKIQEYDVNGLPDVGVFLHRATRYTAWHTAPVVSQLLADVPAMPTGARLLTGGGGAVHSARSVDGGGGVSTSGSEQPNAPTEQPTEQVQPNDTPTGPTDLQAAVWRWRDANPNGTQADMRREFATSGIDISRGYASDCYNEWPTRRVEDFTAGKLTPAQVNALFEAGILSASGGPKPGTERIDWTQAGNNA